MKKVWNRGNLILDILLPIVLLLLIYPNILEQYPFVISVIFFLRKCFFLLAVWCFVRYSLFKRKYIWLWLGLFFWMFVSTVMNGNQIKDIDVFLSNFTMIVFSVYALERNPQKYAGYMSILLTTWLLLNSLLWSEGGTYINSNGQDAFFLGTKTSITYYQIMGCCYVQIYRSLLPRNRKKYASTLWWIMLGSIILYNIRQSISTSMICLSVFILLIVLDNFDMKIYQSILKIGFVSTIIINILVVFFNIQTFFRGFIENVLKESATLSTRTVIWKVVLAKIVQSPIIGHGINSGTTFTIGETTSYNESAHNQLLSWMFLLGIIGLIFVLVICFIGYRNCKVTSRCGRVARITWICFGMFWIVEQWFNYIMFTSFVMLCFCMTQISEQEYPSKRIKFKIKDRSVIAQM